MLLSYVKLYSILLIWDYILLDYMYTHIYIYTVYINILCVYTYIYRYMYVYIYRGFAKVPSKHHWQTVQNNMLQKLFQIQKQSFNCLIGRQRLIRKASHRKRCRSAVSLYPPGTSPLTILVVLCFLGFSAKLQDDCVNTTWLWITKLSQFYTSVQHPSSTLDF